VSTEFYWVPVVDFTGRLIKPISLGVSSNGWCFALHVYPERGLNTLDDWLLLLNRPGSGVFDERHTLNRLSDVLMCIRDRWTEPIDRGEKFYRDQYAEPGPCGMLRHKVMPGHCVGHGEGTWDYMVPTKPRIQR
jgi:hypothetical protein